MAEHKKAAATTVCVKVSANVKYGEATAIRFISDAIFLYEKAITATEELEKKRFSRLAIVVIPFYLECLSNYLYDEFIQVKISNTSNGDPSNRSYLLKYPLIFKSFIVKRMKKLLNCQDIIEKDIDKVDMRTDLPIPLRRFRAVYHKCLNKELKDVDMNCFRDIFTIRNKITAHPKGRSILTSTDSGWKRDDISIYYFKFKDLPQAYSQFLPQHVNLIFCEVHDFLTKYVNDIKNRLTKEQFDYVWPKELINWISKQIPPP